MNEDFAYNTAAASDTHAFVKYMMALGNTFGRVDGSSNLRSVYIYVSIASSC